MPIEPTQNRTLDEWRTLIMKARQSGLSDAEWCRRNDISRNTFNSAIKRLRRKACSIPEKTPAGSAAPDPLFTPTPRQDVVRVGIVEDAPDYGTAYHDPISHTSFDVGTSAVEISLCGACVRVANHADPGVIASVISALRNCP